MSSIHGDNITFVLWFGFLFFKAQVFLKIHVTCCILKDLVCSSHVTTGSELSYDSLLCKEDVFIDSAHIYLQGKVCRRK